MNILTKICVVLLAVIAPVASILFINQATIQQNYKADWETGLQHKIELEKTNRLYSAQIDRLKRQAETGDSESKAKIAQLTREINEAKDQLRLRQREIASRDQKLQDQGKSLDEIKATLAAQRKDNVQLSADLKESWGKNREYKADKDRLADENRELNAKNKTLRNNLRVTQLRLHDEQINNKKLHEQLLAQGNKDNNGDQETPVAPAPDVRVDGSITAVHGNLAQVNVGKAHGVRVGMKLIVFRGDKFIGYLIVEELDVNSAAGSMVDKQFTPQQGDKVTSNLN